MGNKWRLGLRWVLANALAELLGLGMTFAVIAGLVTRLGDRPGAGMAILAFVLAVVSGAIEATVVGLAQWWAFHPWFPTIRRRAWWQATLVGALLAYLLGYLPSAVMRLSEPAGQGTMAEPPGGIVLLLAASLGAVAGAVLSVAQWRVLRRAVQGAGGWAPVNMLAWGAGMPLIFWGIEAAQQRQTLLEALLLLAGILFLTGAVVGAIQGAFLVWLVGRKAVPGAKSDAR